MHYYTVALICLSTSLVKCGAEHNDEPVTRENRPRILSAELSVALNHTADPEIVDVNELDVIARQKNCRSGGHIFKHGQIDGCRQCRCDHGHSHCSIIIRCPVFKCPNRIRKIKPEGKCCYECTACVNSKTRQMSNIGDTYTSVHSPCLAECYCWSDGFVSCPPRLMFLNNTCPNPIKLPLECHPLCPDDKGYIGGAPIPVYPPGIDYSIYCRVITCAQICVRGYIVRTDSDGCPSCQCERTNDVDGPRMCDHQDVSQCDKKCMYGFRYVGGCYKCQCSLCPEHVPKEFMLTTICFKVCTYGSDNNDDNCPICKCLAEGAEATRLLPHLLPHDRNCEHNGLVRMVGDQWLWEHKNCRRCLCKTGGRVFCSAVICPVLNCPTLDQERSDDNCCKRCSGQAFPIAQPVPCSSSHLQLAEGESFKLEGCIVCTCHIGQVLCELKPCKVLGSCSNPVYDASSCCYVCPPKPPVIEARQHLTCNDKGPPIPLHGTMEVDHCHIVECLYNENCTNKCSNCASCTFSRDVFNAKPCGGCQTSVWLAQRCCSVCLPDNGGVCKDGKYMIGYDLHYANGERWTNTMNEKCNCDNGSKNYECFQGDE